MNHQTLLIVALDAVHQAVRVGLDLQEKRQLLKHAEGTLLECVTSDDDIELLLRELVAKRKQEQISDASYKKVLGHLCRFLRDRFVFDDAILSMIDRRTGS